MLPLNVLPKFKTSHFGKPPIEQNPLLQKLGAPHVESFNYMLEEGLNQAVENLIPIEFSLDSDTKVRLEIEHVNIECPTIQSGGFGAKNHMVYPTECRQSARTYKGKMTARVNWYINDKLQNSFDKDLGAVPIMLKSNRCYLSTMSPKELVEHGEHEQEWGGYFIIKGNEKLVRMLMVTRRNYPVAIKRSGWKMRGNLFSEYGILIKCVSNDQTSANNVLHYINDGTAKLMFSYNKNIYFCPVVLILKCLCDYTDHYIYEKLINGFAENSYYRDSIQKMLRELHIEGLHNQLDCKRYIGKTFRVKFEDCPNWYTDEQVTDFILKNCVLIHCDDNEDKFNCLIFMIQKLFVFAQNKTKVEGADAVMMMELLLGGHLYLQIVKEKLKNWLTILKYTILKSNNVTNAYTLTQTEMLNAAKRCGGISNALESFMATGNIVTQSGLGLMQEKGLVIMAENINRMRYMSHFKAVHRGSFFQEMRTTDARQLLPDAWGFICPVHTPDGAPCGLLNHLTMNCEISQNPDQKKIKNIPFLLAELGMMSIKNFNYNIKEHYIVHLDGRIIGYIERKSAKNLVTKLRHYKIIGEKIPNTLEIVLVPIKDDYSQYPGLFLFSGPARMLRPVMNLQLKEIELIGTFEQVYLDICVTTNEFYNGITTHMELEKTNFLSNLAMLIPMPDLNQSPRNMYQCQMGKQTMGTPCHNYNLQTDNKLYRLQTPASPLFKTQHYDIIELDDFAMGTNAIVAVISYTGYDMEDAIVINKASDERGFAHGSIYKSEFIELEKKTSYFCRNPNVPNLASYLDSDGLPIIGTFIHLNDPLYCFYDSDESKYVTKTFHGKEDCYIDTVRLCGNGDSGAAVICITFRVPRNASIGDKFASRAGQKGICSQKWQMEDLPFTESGLVPDIVFNPHGFPSRMTIAMMIEIMAGKTAAQHGIITDATPFKFTEEDTAIDYFGRLLERAGYNYYGTETMYSGIDGREMKSEIFFGIVHYQRLRHMVSDKWQVRSLGPNNAITRQPLKGRKKGGGIRFGEMERDCLISHGASFLLQDRLFHNSDKTLTFICTNCHTLLSTVTVTKKISEGPKQALKSFVTEVCRICGNSKDVVKIEIPYIFKYLVTEFASCNINVQLECKEK